MTSDQGYTGQAEMQMTNTSTPVSTKAPGLNPNANVFHIKNPANITTPPSECGSADWPTPDTSSVSNVQSPASEEFVYMNGDVGKTPPPGVITTTFPPTPESPMSVGQGDYSSVNGVVEGQALFPSDGGQDELPLDSNITDDQRREMIKSQLEYYFSRENLANDSYLVSQMDADQYVSIATIASFNQVKRLTNDLELVIKILRESVNVQVDEKGEKVRPLHKRCIVILREIPDSTPVEAIKKLFMGENCPPFTSCEFAHNDSWYVTFESEEDAQKAYRYLREEVCTFLGKPIMARIKAKPLLHNTFVPKNGFKQSYEPPVYSQPQKFTQYPTVSYLPNQQGYPFFPPGGAAAAAAAAPGTPTPPSASSIGQVWPTSPATLSYFDPGTAFAANGYTPSTTIKIPATRQQSFSSVRHNRNQKLHRGGTPGNREHPGLSYSDRSNDHERSEQRDPQRDRNTQSRDGPRADRYLDRHVAGLSRTFKSDGVSVANNYHNHHHHSSGLVNFNRGSDSRNYHGHHHSSSLQTGQGHTHSHTHQHNSHTTADRDHDPVTSSNSRHSSTSEINNKDQFPQPQRRAAGYRSKRRPRGSDDNGANRSNSSCQQAKEKLCCEPPNFDLADTSFPPLPGSTSNTSSSEVFENKMSDVVKGTAKPSKPASTPAVPSSRVTTATTAVPASQPPQTLQASSSIIPAPAVPTNKEVVKSAPVSQANPSSKPCTSVAKSNTTIVKTSSHSAKPDVINTVTTQPQAQSSNITMASVVTSNTTAAAAAATQKVSKATCTDGAVMTVDMTSVSATASTSTQTCSNGATSMINAASTQDEKTPKKLSYAEMAQRGKAQVVKAAEKSKTDDSSNKDQSTNGATLSTSCETKESVTLSVTVSAVVATTSTGTRSPTHRDQPHDQCAYGTRRPYNNTRRDEHKKERSGYYRTERRGNREHEKSRVK